MAATGKRSTQPGFGEVNGLVGVGNPTAKYQDIGIVMFTGHPGGELISYQCRPDQWIAVGSNGHANAGAADENPPGILAAGHHVSQTVGINRVINRSFRVSSQVGYIIGVSKGGL